MQVLDLEALAQHRGSLLGTLPDAPQPAQKMFETRIWDALRHFDPQQPIFVEAESRKIGVLSMPDNLLEKIRSSVCVRIEAQLESRIELLMEDYVHFLRDPAQLIQRLTPLLPLHGRQVLDHWQQLAEQGDWRTLVGKLLTEHYDPAYQRSTAHNFPQLPQAKVLQLDRLDPDSLRLAAPLAL